MTTILGTIVCRMLFLVCFSLLGIVHAQDLKIEKLSDNFYIYTSYGTYQEKSYPANGMFVLSSEGAILIDTPWNPKDYQTLSDTIRTKFNKEIKFVIGTHWHDDRAGGFSFFMEKNIPTYATSATNKLLQEHNMTVAENILPVNQIQHLGDIRFKIIYPGVGHTKDNILIWFLDQKILYGGCFVKSVKAETIGNYKDGDPELWLKNIQWTRKTFKKAIHVIPGHDEWKGSGQLAKTEFLLMEFINKK